MLIKVQEGVTGAVDVASAQLDRVSRGRMHSLRKEDTLAPVSLGGISRR